MQTVHKPITLHEVEGLEKKIAQLPPDKIAYLNGYLVGRLDRHDEKKRVKKKPTPGN